MELTEKLNINKKLLKNNIFEIKLESIKQIIDMSRKFQDCKSLSSLPDISKWNISKVTDINRAFWLCESLVSFLDISKWNT